MAKGQESKDNVKKKIIEAFGADYAGEYDKKLYVWTTEGGVRTQVCLAMTCPKVFRGVEETTPTALNFEDDGNFPTPAPAAEISKEEKETLAQLMERLGL